MPAPERVPENAVIPSRGNDRQPPPTIAIVDAEGPADMQAARALFVDYQRWLGVDLCFQGFTEELASLPGDYAPPAGRLLLARVDGQPVGCVALRPFDDGRCEMKRLYVLPAHQGLGLGRRLVEAIVAAARTIGYRSMVLDTLDTMQAAIALYRAHGFRDIPAYRFNPLPGARFMQCDL
jgi:carbonic anhydrase